MPTSKSNSRVIGITLGDPGGIGPEVVAKALSRPTVRRLARFVVIGDEGACTVPHSPAVSRHLVDGLGAGGARIGKTSVVNGRAALQYLETAVELLKARRIDALVTAPVSKEAIMLSRSTFIGHTEFLAEAFDNEEVGMMFVNGPLRTIICTRHIPLKDVPKTVTTEAVLTAIRLADRALKTHFGIRRPRIAVCGLNPHAGESGRMGTEEKQVIAPALSRARRGGITATGPFAADTLFIPSRLSDYDCVVAMYHDQGLIPVKTLAFDSVVNLTIGLPFVRTSPAHGTAFDIAGKDLADPASMIAAIRVACELS